MTITGQQASQTEMGYCNHTWQVVQYVFLLLLAKGEREGGLSKERLHNSFVCTVLPLWVRH